MDAFTENILARARERQKMLQGYSGPEPSTPLREFNKTTQSEPNLTEIKTIPPKEIRSESNIPSRLSPNKENNIDSKTPPSQGSPGSKTLNIQRDNFNMEIKVNSSENVRVQVEIEEHDDEGGDFPGQMVEGGLREESKNRLKRLGKLYAGGDDADISSPIHRTEAKFYQTIDNENVKKDVLTKDRSKKGLSKLADLADTINQWEDNLGHPTRSTEQKPSTPRKAWKPPAPQPPKQTTSQKPTPLRSLKPKAPSPPVSSPKKALFPSKPQSSPKRTSSPRVHNTSPKVNENSSEDGFSPNNSPKKEAVSRVGNSPTKALLESPRKWHESPRKGHESPRKGLESPRNRGTAIGAQCVGVTPKQISWDKSVLDSLESQGFTRTTSSSRLVYAYRSQANPEKPLDIQTQTSQAQIEIKSTQKLENSQATPTHFRSGNIANRAAMFESKVNESPAKPGKDPALMSVSERKALFEKNRGGALIPKAAFAMSAPIKVETTMKACESKFIGQKYSKTEENAINKSGQNIGHHSSIAATPSNKQATPSVYQVPPKTNDPASIGALKGGIASKMAALLENKSKSTISEEQIANKVKEERQKEMDMLLNRFNKNKEVCPKPNDIIEEVESDLEYSDSESDDDDEQSAMLKDKLDVVVSQKSAEKRKSGGKLASDSDSPHVALVLDEVKRIKVSPPKAGRLYPNLSDIEATTTETETRTPTPNEENSYEDNNYDSDDPNTSFGRDILQVVCKNQTPQKKVVYDEDSTGSDNSSVLDELDEILEEMGDDLSSSGPTPPKQGRHHSPKIKPQPSNSFHYKSFSASPQKSTNFQSPKKVVTSPRQSTELPLVVDGENVMTLTHTVSFYRKQQNEAHTPSRQKITRQPPLEELSEEVKINQEDQAVEQKIRDLQEEVNKQQNIISQTSRALNLCSSTPEFCGSTEQVEAERVLLVATHRRQTAVHELQRLKVEGTVRSLSQHSRNVPLEKGTLTISNIILPLKQKYVTALAAAGGKGHHVVCLIKCGEQVEPTKLVSTVASNSKNPDVDLYVPGSVTLKNIYSDFTVTFEVYCLQAQEECLPHEVKYHINKKPSKGLTTPKKNKQESRLLRPPKESPAGPQAVRTSSFALMGYVVFSVQAVNKRVWSLNNTPTMSPLEGSVEMKIHCELAVSVEHRGFLTMFEDVSGFGAWHRRWCLLRGHSLSYWKYPDDERKMAPIDTIDLKNCITKEVGPVSRDICARLHTFLLERERMAYPQDRDTLVTVCKGDKTIIRHLLSADTKEERIEWCYKLNAALTANRMWGNSHQ